MFIVWINNLKDERKMFLRFLNLNFSLVFFILFFDNLNCMKIKSKIDCEQEANTHFEDVNIENIMHIVNSLNKSKTIHEFFNILNLQYNLCKIDLKTMEKFYGNLDIDKLIYIKLSEYYNYYMQYSKRKEVFLDRLLSLIKTLKDEELITKIINNLKNIGIDLNKDLTSNKNRPLFEAIKSNDIPLFVILVNFCDVNIKDAYGWTPLMVSILLNSEFMTKVLLSKKADLEIADNNGLTALMHAIQQSRSSIVNLLLEYGANVDARDNYGNTPLFIAINNNDPYIVNLLLIYGANVNVKNDNNDTPLIIATIGDNLSIIRLLLEKGAYVNVKNKDNLSPILVADKLQNKVALKLLYDCFDNNKNNCVFI